MGSRRRIVELMGIRRLALVPLATVASSGAVAALAGPARAAAPSPLLFVAAGRSPDAELRPAVRDAGRQAALSLAGASTPNRSSAEALSSNCAITASSSPMVQASDGHMP